MNNLKYRIWDKQRKIMCPVARISFGDDGAALTILVEPAPSEDFYRALVDGESGILMQFTGLTDKNGKELYEGDIVQTYSSKMKNGVFQIKYLERGFCMSQNEDDTSIDCPWFYEFEVIGNIYQNPELITP